jgi:hypothetical protein
MKKHHYTLICFYLAFLFLSYFLQGCKDREYKTPAKELSFAVVVKNEENVLINIDDLRGECFCRLSNINQELEINYISNTVIEIESFVLEEDSYEIETCTISLTKLLDDNSTSGIFKQNFWLDDNEKQGIEIMLDKEHIAVADVTFEFN